MSTLTAQRNPLQQLEDALLSNVMGANEMQRKMQQAMCRITPVQAMTMSRRTASLSQCQFISDEHEGAIGAGQLNLEPAPPETLPAVISDALRAADMRTVKWADLSMMPGMAIAGVRALGNAIFTHFGIVKNSPVKVIAALEDGDMLNSNMDVNAVLHFLEQAAVKCSPDNMKMTFEGVIDDYAPEVRLYHTAEHAYLAVLEEDTGCRYIYAFARQRQVSHAPVAALP